jgi:hypothetical protein
MRMLEQYAYAQKTVIHPLSMRPTISCKQYTRHLIEPL